ncbi:hypothetical protein [Paenibacillus lautus]|jgi:hypothetical protein|uniref:hypothetical protein n=1 Tax=Paenibacillus lautus TaxID=1401 RepID=UPI000FD9B3B2|nr:hypothetical protein [Paenibacillus lautus]
MRKPFAGYLCSNRDKDEVQARYIRFMFMICQLKNGFNSRRGSWLRGKENCTHMKEAELQYILTDILVW